MPGFPEPVCSPVLGTAVCEAGMESISRLFAESGLAALTDAIHRRELTAVLTLARGSLANGCHAGRG